MTRSCSTPRVHFTQALYLTVVALTASTHGHLFTGRAGELARIAGLICVALAGLGRIWTSLFIAGRKDRELVTDGPYSLCRNPLYALSLIGAVGIGLASRSLVLTLALPCVLLLAFHRAARVEEAFLATMHGAEFAAYVASTSRFWPDRRGYRSRHDVTVPTAIYFKAFLDAGSLILVYVLVLAADLLARSAVAPGLFPLP